jgi:hypothetical protein
MNPLTDCPTDINVSSLIHKSISTPGNPGTAHDNTYRYIFVAGRNGDANGLPQNYTKLVNNGLPMGKWAIYNNAYKTNKLTLFEGLEPNGNWFNPKPYTIVDDDSKYVTNDGTSDIYQWDNTAKSGGIGFYPSQVAYLYLNNPSSSEDYIFELSIPWGDFVIFIDRSLITDNPYVRIYNVEQDPNP